MSEPLSVGRLVPETRTPLLAPHHAAQHPPSLAPSATEIRSVLGGAFSLPWKLAFYSRCQRRCQKEER
jgi:hypothetical protein